MARHLKTQLGGRQWPGRVLVSLLILLCLSVTPVNPKPASADGTPRTAPPVLHGKEKWRIAYYEGGPYDKYQACLKYMVLALMDLGWVNRLELPDLPDASDTRALWDWLSGPRISDYLTFLPDGRWSLDWDSSRRGEAAGRIALQASAGDVDLILALGTWAGQDLVRLIDGTPIMVMSASEPQEAGIVRSPTDSGRDNVHAWCDPERIPRRLRLFYYLLHFRRLGLIYDDTPERRMCARLDVVLDIGKQCGFEVNTCEAEDTDTTLPRTRFAFPCCLECLARKTDAFVLMDHRGFDRQGLPALFEPFYRHGVVTFSPVNGPETVRRGMVFGLGRKDHASLGRYYASVLSRILGGEKPRNIEQVYSEPVVLSVNREAAARTGYVIPASLLQIADPISDRIE